MEINIAAGIGTGSTKLAAFDMALNEAGVANYNLIRLSSVIPPKSKIKIHSSALVKSSGEWGDRLYVVMAELRVDTPNTEAWAGIGWVQDKLTGKGLFVEHEGKSEKSVKRDINESLKNLMTTRKVDFGEINMKIIGATCEHQPVCALVVAVYKSSSWSQ